MNETRRFSLIKPLLAAAVAIGGGTLLFQGFTQAATGAELRKTEKVPTIYAASAAPSSAAPSSSAPSTHPAQTGLPAGYQKADYAVGNIDLEFYRDKVPSSKDMTKQDAAEIGAQALWTLFGLNLEGQRIEMGYQPANENLPRSSWYGDVLIDNKRSYSFSVDSVTGELLTVNHTRTLTEKISVAFDSTLDDNPQEYVELAKNLAEKLNVLQGAIKSAQYNGQGYSDNDPTLSIDIADENGEIALMTFSRYDKTLLGIIYNTEYKNALERAAKLGNEAQERLKEILKSTSDATQDKGTGDSFFQLVN
ncbi:hypothetical protein [Gorillibacterium massiliense]|uniref:hypothetical protein n=1 Tax=Gorillibacterium massiliense TaxID=1280390 RepID=UPI0004B28A24|nr:hypothetical protein [Gorillibacterium massiliense]